MSENPELVHTTIPSDVFARFTKEVGAFSTEQNDGLIFGDELVPAHIEFIRIGDIRAVVLGKSDILVRLCDLLEVGESEILPVVESLVRLHSAVTPHNAKPGDSVPVFPQNDGATMALSDGLKYPRFLGYSLKPRERAGRLYAFKLTQHRATDYVLSESEPSADSFLSHWRDTGRVPLGYYRTAIVLENGSFTYCWAIDESP